MDRLEKHAFNYGQLLTVCYQVVECWDDPDKTAKDLSAQIGELKDLLDEIQPSLPAKFFAEKKETPEGTEVSDG